MPSRVFFDLPDATRKSKIEVFSQMKTTLYSILEGKFREVQTKIIGWIDIAPDNVETTTMNKTKQCA